MALQSPTSETFINWTDDFLLGHKSIDHRHQEFVNLVQAMQKAPLEQLPEHFPALLSHLKEHFEAENQLMIRSDFPPRDCHIQEHNAVLQSAFEVQQEMEKGNLNVVRSFVNELAKWFPMHTQHLDSALTHWLSKLSRGAQTIVLKRNILKPTSET